MDLDKLSRLADLTITDSEKKELEPQLSEVVKFFDQLNEVDTSDTQPTSQTTGLVDVTRPDHINPTRILSIETETNNYFVVNALLDKDQA